ncbi:MAG: hypothetical protein JNN07_13680 [Verrucomicrobiales bacterium]|nr:hypothetical protein [Verrucomicrobiales bacterium]
MESTTQSALAADDYIVLVPGRSPSVARSSSLARPPAIQLISDRFLRSCGCDATTFVVGFGASKPILLTTVGRVLIGHPSAFHKSLMVSLIIVTLLLPRLSEGAVAYRSGFPLLRGTSQRVDASLGMFTNKYYPLKSFLISPPSIQRIAFRKSGLYFRVEGRPFPKNFVEFEGAIQSNTFYTLRLTHLTNPDLPGFAGEAAGLSYSAFWELKHEVASIADRDQRHSGADASPIPIVESAYGHLEDILGLGFSRPDRSSFQWTSETEFEVRVLAGTDFVPIRGQVIEDDGDRPTVLGYSGQAPFPFEEKLHYIYEDDLKRPNWLPARIVRERTVGSTLTSRITNEISSLTIGVRDLGSIGYSEDSMLARGLSPRSNAPLVKAYYSNNTAYVRSKGKWMAVQKPDIGLGSKLESSATRQSVLRMVYFVVGILLLGLVLRLTRRKRSHKP